LSRRGHRLSVHASGIDTHCDSTTSRFDCRPRQARPRAAAQARRRHGDQAQRRSALRHIRGLRLLLPRRGRRGGAAAAGPGIESLCMHLPRHGDSMQLPVQEYAVPADCACGSTIGPILSAATGCLPVPRPAPHGMHRIVGESQSLIRFLSLPGTGSARWTWGWRSSACTPCARQWASPTCATAWTTSPPSSSTAVFEHC
jgi:hypothetical protein